MSDVQYRTATLAEVRLILDWAAEEGWNPGLEDTEAFHAADPQGYFVATVQDTPITAISVINHSDAFAFLGLYLCRPEYRGRGISFGLWAHALEHAGERTVGLDGVPAQEANYEKSGFVLVGRTRRWQGVIPATGLVCPIASPDDFEAVQRLDRAANGIDRDAFLKAWVAPSATRKTVLLVEQDRVTGFATARICKEGCKIGPIVAPSLSAAVDLVHQAAAAVGETTAIVDIPDTCPDFARALGAAGFVETFATARMYRGRAPEAGPGLFAIATMELG